ncbi:hypothetical protein CKA32_004785 [Geitlerinema sp. FC II]|nr:hypothetical protein CKA32_004785 [Geitlerinema sp. FC II]
MKSDSLSDWLRSCTRGINSASGIFRLYSIVFCILSDRFDRPNKIEAQAAIATPQPHPKDEQNAIRQFKFEMQRSPISDYKIPQKEFDIQKIFEDDR